VKRTDYAKIADVYDENEIRKRIPQDELIAALVARGSAARPSVLDLACGTGNYLAVQVGHFGDAVAWFGVDASPAMLGHARRKVAGVDLREGRAEALPYEAGRFDYVTTRFAFHHFEDKQGALDEAARVVSSGGTLRIVNVAPERMPGWWLYRFFPASRFEDDDRFWSVERLAFEVERRGLEVALKIEILRSRVPLATMLADAERRELSQLAILDDAAFAAGTGAIRARVAAAPNGREPDEIALVELTAKKP
jgi:SAM-dependent methyltransferase